jgi:molybdopterin-containing oxidoreductase family iron-sulfur binding subunit
LQELPDPVSKIVWDNYLIISPVLADKLKVRDGSMVRLSTGTVTTELPVYIAPGQHPESVAVAIGYGRSAGGELVKEVGFDVSAFIAKQEQSLIYSGLNVTVEKTGRDYQLAQTQGHHSMEGRQLAVETTEPNYKKTGDIGFHRHAVFSIWSGHKYDGHKWAMSVDLNSCTGCSACMIACQSENNIPVVGKKYVLGGREMHWIRIDRYFSGDEKKSVDAIFHPVMCQHCENAPCETVCPVLATVHSDEGLNDMVYNRCVGTRYCSNNCPYKVRRFNWFYYDGHHRREPLHMALNPDVTVRTRGVMEKCTFCVQRIKEAKNTARDEKRNLRDGDIRTACQSVCPTDAIIFGDLNDPESRVAKHFDKKFARQYTLLEEFNAAPRVRYLAKVRNTDRDLGGHHHQPHSDQAEGHQGGHA